MNRSLRITTALCTLALVGCATRGQLREAVAEQQAALEAERTERMAADERLAGDVAALQTDLAALRTDLADLRTEFGAQITALEEGLQFAMPVHFGFDQADVRMEDQAVLDRFAQVVQRHYPGATITVEGFTDPAGSAAYNHRLSQRRAEAVRAYLLTQGLPEAQLRAVGYGEERAVVPGATDDESGAEMNRRVVFVIETPPTAVASAPGG